MAVLSVYGLHLAQSVFLSLTWIEGLQGGTSGVFTSFCHVVAILIHTRVKEVPTMNLRDSIEL